MYIPGTTCLHIPCTSHSSCTSLVILIFIKSTVDCIAHFSSLHISLILFYCFYLLFFFLILFLPIFKYMLLCYVSSFIFIFLHCPLSGPVLTYISLLIIPCMIVYVTNKQEPCKCNNQSYLKETRATLSPKANYIPQNRRAKAL